MASAQWWTWAPSAQLTIGIEEELMLLDPRDWSLAFRADEAIAALGGRATLETHAAVIEVATGVHSRVPDAIAELAALRSDVSRGLAAHGLRAAVAGTHPSAVWSDTVIGSARRYREIGASMRVLARREPTLALHVHVGISSPEAAVRVMNRLRAHLPLLLALSANSPYWQGRATGFASTRTTLFGAFPRTGIPRRFRDYADWVGAVRPLVRSGAIADPSMLWWDVRLQPRYGTVEVRIMDGQTEIADVAALVALVQSLAALEIGVEDTTALEVLEENRFLASRDGMDALFIDDDRRIPAMVELELTLAACRAHAARLGCEPELLAVRALAADTGAKRQLAGGDPRRATANLAAAYAPVALARAA